MTATPLDQLAREFESYDRNERAEMLIDYADRFVEVPPEVATRPFPPVHAAPRCESEAYVWAVDRGDGTLKFHFAVENPQGLSAKATRSKRSRRCRVTRSSRSSARACRWGRARACSACSS